MKIKGILFDKDGTILKFQDLWLDAAKHVLRNFIIINHLPQTEEMCLFLSDAIGVKKGIVKPDGPLGYMTYEQIGAVIATALRTKNPKWNLSDELSGRQMSVLFETALMVEELSCTPTCDLKMLLGKLKKNEIYTGLATADNPYVTKQCLKRLEIEKEFDFIGCDDGVLCPKPAPDIFRAFCEKYELRAEEVAVIGDTANDMQFAKACGGIAVGTLSGLAEREDLDKLADHIIDTPADILSLLEIE